MTFPHQVHLEGPDLEGVSSFRILLLIRTVAGTHISNIWGFVTFCACMQVALKLCLETKFTSLVPRFGSCRYLGSPGKKSCNLSLLIEGLFFSPQPCSPSSLSWSTRLEVGHPSCPLQAVAGLCLLLPQLFIPPLVHLTMTTSLWVWSYQGGTLDTGASGICAEGEKTRTTFTGPK